MKKFDETLECRETNKKKRMNLTNFETIKEDMTFTMSINLVNHYRKHYSY
ncbi:25429_t:CDS:2 [Dentiscutata erythropus]|uniref:25429_t:CDS:1 n=1 Tax=Dentiscutata erythropus TaxID=1348616 RepID=A0A9N8WFQ5_9GLOM|nr:25429_t:CDS:2 [Dentiscutata erythropus]